MIHLVLIQRILHLNLCLCLLSAELCTKVGHCLENMACIYSLTTISFKEFKYCTIQLRQGCGNFGADMGRDVYGICGYVEIEFIDFNHY